MTHTAFVFLQVRAIQHLVSRPFDKPVVPFRLKHFQGRELGQAGDQKDFALLIGRAFSSQGRARLGQTGGSLGERKTRLFAGHRAGHQAAGGVRAAIILFGGQTM